MAWTDMTQLTNCYAWFKPESLASSYANGDPISSWSDSSGNGRDISQATSANQPLALANAINGYMAADFDGSNDILSSASYTQSGDVVVSIVIELDTISSYRGIMAVDDASPPAFNSGSTWACMNVRFAQDTVSGSYFFEKNSPSYGYISSLTVPAGESISTTNKYIFSATYSSLGHFFRANGDQLSQTEVTGSPGSASSGSAYIHLGWAGISSYLDGKVCELIIYDGVDSYFSEVVWVEGYLADKYAITLPAGHLFKNEPPANAPTTYNPSGGTKFHPLS